jgi:hypothetical protein
MPITKFDSDRYAKWYANRHIKVDPGVVAVYYLPVESPDREIRLVEVNDLMAERTDDSLQPVDFSVNSEPGAEHVLRVLDVTPRQWRLMKRKRIDLPNGWSLRKRRVLRRPE